MNQIGGIPLFMSCRLQVFDSIVKFIVILKKETNGRILPKTWFRTKQLQSKGTTIH